MSTDHVPGPKQPPRLHGEGCICGDFTRYECPVKDRQKPKAPPSSNGESLDKAIEYYETHERLASSGMAFINAPTLGATLGFLRELKERRAVETSAVIDAEVFEGDRVVVDARELVKHVTIRMAGNSDVGLKHAQRPGDFRRTLERLLSYTEACEGLLNAAPAGQVIEARKALGLHENGTARHANQKQRT